MSERSKPPFRADHVGSLIRPETLIAAREEAESGGDRAELKRIQEQAIRDVVAMQEDIGLQARHRRRIQSRRLAPRLPAAVRECAADPVEDHGALPFGRGHARAGPPSWQVAGKLARPKPIFVDDFRYLASVARGDAEDHHPLADHDAFPRRARRDRPRRLSGHGGVLRRPRAASTREEIADLAAAGCRYLQIDEVNLAYLCDPALRAQVQQYRRGPGLAAEDLREAAQRHDRAAGRPT